VEWTAPARALPTHRWAVAVESQQSNFYGVTGETIQLCLSRGGRMCDVPNPWPNYGLISDCWGSHHWSPPKGSVHSHSKWRQI
jgi:hypothetical protein